MSEDEMQKKMAFIIEQQAQFAAASQRQREIQEAEAKLWREKYNGLTDALTTVVGMVGKLAEEQKLTGTKLRELAEAQAEAQARTDARWAETDERLNIFINVIERYISERRNGRAPDNGNSENPPAA